MPKKKYLVVLSETERNELSALTRKGHVKARVMKRAQVLLKADAGATDPEITAALDVSRPCVERIRKRFAVGGRLARALYDAPRPGLRRRLDGKQEARLIAEACSQAPEGRAHWTMQLLADRAVVLGLAEQLSRETVRRLLKKTKLSRGSRASGVFQP
jgi:transposase